MAAQKKQKTQQYKMKNDEYCYNRHRIICDSFPPLKIGVNNLKYVSRFKYLGNIVSIQLV